MTKFDIASIPELETTVGIHGSVSQQEVAGAMCIGAVVALGILIYGDGS